MLMYGRIEVAYTPMPSARPLWSERRGSLALCGCSDSTQLSPLMAIAITVLCVAMLAEVRQMGTSATVVTTVIITVVCQTASPSASRSSQSQPGIAPTATAKERGKAADSYFTPYSEFSSAQTMCAVVHAGLAAVLSLGPGLRRHIPSGLAGRTNTSIYGAHTQLRARDQNRNRALATPESPS
jgi:hypothetical protein